MIPQYNLDGLGAEFKKTQELEKRIADFLGVKHCIMTTSGFAALFLAIKALGWKEVEVPALTMIATATAPELAGAKVKFYDQVPSIGSNAIHVSLNGRDCAIAQLISDEIPFIEDACQAFGSQYNGQYLGTFGLIGCFSFQAYKLISSGNGGCCVTNDDELANEIRKLKNFGRVGGGDVHDKIGYNFKFTDIQAEVLLKQMDDIESKIAKKKHIYSEYKKYLGEYMLPHDGTPWFSDIYINDRECLVNYLNEDHIGTRPMYPLIPSQMCYQIRWDQDFRSEYPVGFEISRTGLWLPSSLDLTDEQIKYISNRILEYVRK